MHLIIQHLKVHFGNYILSAFFAVVVGVVEQSDIVIVSFLPCPMRLLFDYIKPYLFFSFCTALDIYIFTLLLLS